VRGGSKSSVETIQDDKTINEEDLEEDKEELKDQVIDYWSMISEEASQRSESVAVNPYWNEFV